MAQGLLTWLAPTTYQVFSAGTHPTQIHPLTARVMAELGIDVWPQGVHAVTDYLATPFDLVVTVCDTAREACPIFRRAARQEHWGFADPAVVLWTDQELPELLTRARSTTPTMSNMSSFGPSADPDVASAQEGRPLDAPACDHWRQ
jgi:arsenate reductase